MRYMLQSKQSGEVYVSDGVRSCGPLHYSDMGYPLEDYNLDREAPEWVTSRDGRLLREDEPDFWHDEDS